MDEVLRSRLCLGCIPDSVLRDNSWWRSEDHVGCWGQTWVHHVKASILSAVLSLWLHTSSWVLKLHLDYIISEGMCRPSTFLFNFSKVFFEIYYSRLTIAKYCLGISLFFKNWETSGGGGGQRIMQRTGVGCCASRSLGFNLSTAASDLESLPGEDSNITRCGPNPLPQF